MKRIKINEAHPTHKNTKEHTQKKRDLKRTLRWCMLLEQQQHKMNTIHNAIKSASEKLKKEKQNAKYVFLYSIHVDYYEVMISMRDAYFMYVRNS